MNNLSQLLGAEIVRKGFNLVSGFGVGIAEQTILGAFRAVYECELVQPAERVLIRPFPGSTPAVRRSEVFKRHREDMIARVGALVVVAGNKADGDGGSMPSAGVEEEVQIALGLRKPVIPIGVSGHVAQALWQQAVTMPEHFLPGLIGTNALAVLGDSEATNEQIVRAVISLLEEAERASSAKVTAR